MRFDLVKCTALTALLLAATPFAPAAAQDAPYLDDRSTPQALVRSLYNAINRKEYARAYGYFANPPAPTLEEYAQGYDGTDAVAVVVGSPAIEGVAGSTFYTLPVAIAASGTGEQVFSGCYTMRFADPHIQGTPFVPLSIEKGTLAPASGPIETAIPTVCPDAPALPQQNLAMERAKARFMASRLDRCQVEEGNDPQAWDIGFHYASDGPDEPERKVTLVRFYCTRGAYNETHVFYLIDDIGDLRELHFAHPELDIRYENDDSDGKVEDIYVSGFNAQDGLVNSEYDPDTRTLTSWSKWRGLGDASSIGRWIFRNGDFALVKFEVDASYDGEISHETVVDYDTGP